MFPDIYILSGLKGTKKMKRLEFIFKTHISNTDRESGGSYINQDNLFIIIDGVGGEYLGEIAREQAHHIIPETFSRHLSENKSPGDALVYALEEANQGVLEERRKLGEKMAASVCAVYIINKIMYFTHLGDCRIYSFHEGELNQLTRDHTLKEEDPFAENRINDPRAMYALTQGLGIHFKPDIKIKKYPLDNKGLILMVTSSLTERLTDRDILNLARNLKNPKKLCDGLIDLSIRKGGDGNITLGILRFGGLSKLLRNIIVSYAVFFLIIIAVMTGYSLRYGGENSDIDSVGVVKPEQETEQAVQEAGAKIKEKIVVPIRPVEEVTVEPTPTAIEIKPEQISGEKEAKDDGPELYSHIYALINEWKKAWEETSGESGSIEEYISFYSDNFQVDGFDKEKWKIDKERKGRKKIWISIGMSDIKISGPNEDNRVEVRFSQDYKSSNFSVKSEKHLVLENDGTEWKIVDERSY